jgi:hypothetical protein
VISSDTRVVKTIVTEVELLRSSIYVIVTMFVYLRR